MGRVDRQMRMMDLSRTIRIFLLVGGLSAPALSLAKTSSIYLVDETQLFSSKIESDLFKRSKPFSQRMKFWQIELKTTLKDGAALTDMTGGLQTYRSLKKEKAKKVPIGSVGDACGVEQKWKAKAELQGTLPARSSKDPDVNFNRGAVQLPDGFAIDTTADALKEIESLIKFNPDAPTATAAQVANGPKEIAAASAKFVRGDETLLYIAGRDEFSIKITLYWQAPKAKKRKNLGTYNFIVACP
jgi:hypothetical protein